MRWWRHQDWIREDHFWSWERRVEVLGWGVKKGGKEYVGGNWKGVVVVVVVAVVDMAMLMFLEAFDNQDLSMYTPE